MRDALVLIHLLAVIVWVGGMFFAHFCLRPVAAAQLPPPQRLPLMQAVLGRFFAIVGVAVAVLWISGSVRLAQTGAGSPWNWHAMTALGLAMSVIFGLIALRFYPRLRAAVAVQDWPAGAQALNAIRALVLTNLILGAVAIALAVLR